MPRLKAHRPLPIAHTIGTGKKERIECPKCDWHADRYIEALGDSTKERPDLRCQCHRKQQSSEAASAPPPAASHFVVNPERAAKRKAAGGG